MSENSSNNKNADLNRRIGNKVYMLRQERNMTQAEFSELLEISVTFLSEIENGKKCMSVDTLIRMSQKLHISLDSIALNENPQDGLQSSVVSIMKTLPLEYNESILAIAQELSRRCTRKDKS